MEGAWPKATGWNDAGCKRHRAESIGHRVRAEGHSGQLASPSLGHYATLSFIIRGKDQVIADCGCKIQDAGCRIQTTKDDWELRKKETGGRIFRNLACFLQFLTF